MNSAKGFCGWKPLFGIKKIITHPEARFAGLHLFRIAAFFDLVAELVKNVLLTDWLVGGLGGTFKVGGLEHFLFCIYWE